MLLRNFESSDGEAAAYEAQLSCLPPALLRCQGKQHGELQQAVTSLAVGGPCSWERQVDEPMSWRAAHMMAVDSSAVSAERAGGERHVTGSLPVM